MSEEYIKPGRVLIAFQIIFVPLYFIFLSNSLKPVSIPLIPESALELIVRIVIPIVLSIPFVIFSYLQRYEISEAYENMGETVWNLPNSIKVFYGFNFFVLILFGLPFIAPIISFSGGYFLGLTIMGKKEDVVQISRPMIKYFTLLFLPFAVLMAVIFYSQVGDFFAYLITLWENNIDFIYLSSLNIANGALVSGALLSSFEFFGRDDYSFKEPRVANAIIGFFTFITLEALLIYFIFYSEPLGELTTAQNLLFIAVNILGFLLSIIVIILRYYLRGQHLEEGTGLLGYVTIFIFQLVNILSSHAISLLSRTSAILLTSIIFIILFISSYYKALKYV